MKIGNRGFQEAVNYYTIKTFLGLSDQKTEPFFNHLSKSTDFSSPLTNSKNEISRLLNAEISKIEKTYETTVKSFERLHENDYIIQKGDRLYPKLLEKTTEAPPFLFMRGNIQLLNEKIVSVVGTRNPSNEGKEKANRLAKLLGKYQITVASGLAMGIDTAAHQAALANKQLTIAVIGTPLTKVYPKENEYLQQKIAREGLIISQFPPSAVVQRWNFPMRNAVMSGISLATVVVEAGETSGALIQANFALKQNRLVFIPQSALDNPEISWPNIYLKRRGAFSFNKIDDLLSKLENYQIIINNEQITLFPEGPATPDVLKN